MYTNLHDKKVLYIEDDLVVLHNISALLEHYFSIISAFSSAEKALKFFDTNAVDLLIVDIELPGINGIEFIKRIRQKNQNIPVIIISAYTNTDYLLESVELNISKYIVKPFTSKKLYSMLEKLNTLFTSSETFELLPSLHVNIQNSSLTFENQIYKLTPKELKFLHILHVKHFIHYDDIIEIWHEHSPSDDAIRSFIKLLRKKLPKNSLKNQQNVGYYV